MWIRTRVCGRCGAFQELRRHWNPSVFHVMPPRFKGIKPQTGARQRRAPARRARVTARKYVASVAWEGLHGKGCMGRAAWEGPRGKGCVEGAAWEASSTCGGACACVGVHACMRADEPWARDAIVYAQKTGSFERIFNADAFGDGTVGREEYNDERCARFCAARRACLAACRTCACTCTHSLKMRAQSPSQPREPAITYSHTQPREPAIT